MQLSRRAAVVASGALLAGCLGSGSGGDGEASGERTPVPPAETRLGMGEWYASESTPFAYRVTDARLRSELSLDGGVARPDDGERILVVLLTLRNSSKETLYPRGQHLGAVAGDVIARRREEIGGTALTGTYEGRPSFGVSVAVQTDQEQRYWYATTLPEAAVGQGVAPAYDEQGGPEFEVRWVPDAGATPQ